MSQRCQGTKSLRDFEKLPGTQINVPRLNLHKRPRHRRCPTSRDFVPWRFSDAGRRSAWIASSCRHPKTCTPTDSCTAAKRISIQSPRRRGRAALAVWKALNQCFLMGADYFIVPTSPDYYCNQAISSLSRVLPKWSVGVTSFRVPSLLYPFPAKPPKFCGIISQRYRPRMGNPAQSFQQWINIIKQTVLQEFVPALNLVGMSISVTEFNDAAPGDTPFNLINIADFNSLIAQSQKHSTPVFALSDAQIEQAGVILTNMK